MSGDLEDFLRRAAALRRSQSPNRPNAPPPKPPKAGQPPKPGARSRSATPPRANQPRGKQPPRPPQPPPPRSREIVAAEIIEEALPVHNVTGDDIAAQVSQHLSTRDFAKRIGHLGEHTGQADERMHKHLHQVFDHQLGKLASPTNIADAGHLAAMGPPDPSPPIDMPLLFSLLRSADGLRNMILVNEILNRPVHRW